MSDSPNTPQRPDDKSRTTFEKNRFEDMNLHQVHSQLLREKEEPTENFSPAPLFLVALFMVMAFWAGIYLVHYSGDFGPFHYDETQKPGTAEDAEPVEVDMMALGRRVYSQNCVACHQSSGQGLPGVYPTLVNSDWVKDNPERLVKVVLAGLAGPVTVNGQSYNNAMTAFGRLSDQQIAAVLTFIRTDESYSNDSHPVSEELVAKVRSEYGSRAEPWTQPDLEAIHGPVTGEWQPAEVPAKPEGEAEETEAEEPTAEDTEVSGDEEA